MFSTPILVGKINSSNCKGYVHDKLIKELINGKNEG